LGYGTILRLWPKSSTDNWNQHIILEFWNSVIAMFRENGPFLEEHTNMTTNTLVNIADLIQLIMNLYHEKSTPARAPQTYIAANLFVCRLQEQVVFILTRLITNIGIYSRSIAIDYLLTLGD
jgi:hypothetical protein